jgi:opacity protein-like surface antigen
MKRIFGLVAVLVFGLAVPAMALIGPETSVGVRLGTGFYQSDDVFDTNLDFKNPTVVGVTAGIRQGHLGAELSVDWISMNLESDIKQAKLTTTPILVTFQFHPAEEDATIDPYLGLGVGYYINSASASSEAKNVAASLGVPDYKVEVDNAVGFHLGVGANMKVSSALAFVIDARYAFMNTDFRVKGTGLSDSDTLSVNGFVVTAGLKYFFPK